MRAGFSFFLTGLRILATIPLIRIAKDVAAGAVLLTAMISIMVGLLVLGPPLWTKVLMLFACVTQVMTLFACVPPVLMQPRKEYRPRC